MHFEKNDTWMSIITALIAALAELQDEHNALMRRVAALEADSQLKALRKAGDPGL